MDLFCVQFGFLSGGGSGGFLGSTRAGRSDLSSLFSNVLFNSTGGGGVGFGRSGSGGSASDLDLVTPRDDLREVNDTDDDDDSDDGTAGAAGLLFAHRHNRDEA